MLQFTPKDLRELAACFFINVDFPGEHCPQLRYMIDHLPDHLRVSRMAHLFSRTGLTKKLCSIHDRLDLQTVSIIFDSLRIEVADSVQYVGQYADILGPDEVVNLKRTTAIQEMWMDSKKTSPSDPHKTYHMQWKYQADQCQACMLSRVASNPTVLRELRTMILAKISSKDKTPLHHNKAQSQPSNPLILSFINEWILLTDQKDELFYLSGQRAAVIKDIMQEWEAAQAANHQNMRDSRLKDRTSSEYPHTPNRSTFWKSLWQSSSPSTLNLSHTSASAIPSYPSSISPLHSPNCLESLDLGYNDQYHTIDIKSFQLPPPEETSPSPPITSYYHNMNNVTPKYKEHREREPTDCLPKVSLCSRLDSPWSSTEALRDPRSHFSNSTVSSSPSTYTSLSMRPSSQELHEMPVRSIILPPIPDHSPIVFPPVTPVRHPSSPRKFASR